MNFGRILFSIGGMKSKGGGDRGYWYLKVFLFFDLLGTNLQAFQERSDFSDE